MNWSEKLSIKQSTRHHSLVIKRNVFSELFSIVVLVVANEKLQSYCADRCQTRLLFARQARDSMLDNLKTTSQSPPQGKLTSPESPLLPINQSP